jgi:neutral trehalase
VTTCRQQFEELRAEAEIEQSKMRFQKQLDDKRRTFEKRLDITRRRNLDGSFDSINNGSGRDSTGGDSFVEDESSLSPILPQKQKYLFKTYSLLCTSF